MSHLNYFYWDDNIRYYAMVFLPDVDQVNSYTPDEKVDKTVLMDNGAPVSHNEDNNIQDTMRDPNSYTNSNKGDNTKMDHTKHHNTKVNAMTNTMNYKDNSNNTEYLHNKCLSRQAPLGNYNNIPSTRHH